MVFRWRSTPMALAAGLSGVHERGSRWPTQLRIGFGRGKLRTVKNLRYVELKSGHSDNGPAWIGYVTSSKTGRTLYFNGRGLMKLKGQRRGASGGNYVDMETGESFWVSGVKKNVAGSSLDRIGESAD